MKSAFEESERKSLQIVVAGMGFLGEYLIPGYRALCPHISSSVASVKGTEKGLKEKPARIPFPVTAGNLAQVLWQRQPDILVFSPPPEKARSIFSEDIVPYLKKRTDNGEAPCVIYSFVPDIEPSWFSQEAGKEIPAAKIMPSMAEPIGNLDPSPLGASLYTTAFWNEEQETALQRFLVPFGESFHLKDSETMAFLAGKITSHLCCNLAMTLADGAAKHGMAVSTEEIGEAIRYFHRIRQEAPPQELVPARPKAVPEPLLSFLQKLEKAWFSGILDFTYSRRLSVEPETAERISHLSFEMNVLSVQLENRDKLEENTRHHATPGGLLEKGCILYGKYVEKELAEAMDRVFCGKISDSFFDLLEGWSFFITLSVFKHGGRLGKEAASE